MDAQIPFMVRNFMYVTVPLISIVIIVSYSTPIFLVVVVPMAIFYIIFQVSNVDRVMLQTYCSIEMYKCPFVAVLH